MRAPICGGDAEEPSTVKPKLVEAPAAGEPLQVERSVITLPLRLGDPFHTGTTCCEAPGAASRSNGRPARRSR
ncbi:hypothetical protein NC658_05990 [Streptomyces griseoincarnatus]|uniref:Uncharacterized protein n=1 Tax=Streptomyces griseoincarnatus TaxID=29305 RepID=A0ABT0VN72_STRGI|nr:MULTISPECIES: hypothetical protein [Streptomyces]MCM2512812.1 hypothetical protein [Streptomyces griseoincarnatus]